MDFDEYEYLEKAVEVNRNNNSEDTVGGKENNNKLDERESGRGSIHRSDASPDESDHLRSKKRLRSEDDSRSRQKERSSRHRRSSSRDRERGERDRDKEKNGRENRDRDKEKSGRENRDRNKEDQNTKERDRERDRGKDRRERDRGYERDKVRERERERSDRGRSHSQKVPDEQGMEGSREREYRVREKEREFKDRDREPRRYKDKKEEKVEPEVDPERDQRTVFAYQISLKADERDVYEFFSRAGKVRDVRLIMDRISKRSKGVGYIEFYDVMSVPMAIALSGQPLLGQPVMVKPSEAEKNLVQPTAAAGGTGGLTTAGARKLYVGNLHFNFNENQLRQVFEPFGTVELVQLPTDPETGHCKGFGFVQFARLEDAKAAQSLNGQLEIAGRVIKVSAVTDQVGMPDGGANTGDLDDDEGGGMSLNAHSRALLMQKLDRTGTASSIAGSLGSANSTGVSLSAPTLGAVPAMSSLVASLGQMPIPTIAGLPGTGLSVPAVALPAIDVIGVPSECLLLKNMFDPKLETEPDFDLDIKEDVQDECSKFGMLRHIYVDKNTAGFVYLRFENSQSAIGAQRALHGRWFAGKMITATFMLPQEYEAKFPDSR